MMISVCMATYNGARYLTEQINSILTELGPNDELIVSDDGSTDETLSILQSYTDSRIRILHHTKVPQRFTYGYTSANFENALSQACGEIIFLADQDDIWIPGRVAAMCSALEHADLVLSDCTVVNSQLSVIVESKFKAEGVHLGVIRNLIHSSYLGSAMAFRLSILQYVLPFPKNTPHDLWIGLMVRLKGRSVLLNQPSLLYRRHQENVSATASIFAKKEITLRKNTHTIWFKLSYRFIVLRAIIYRLISPTTSK